MVADAVSPAASVTVAVSVLGPDDAKDNGNVAGPDVPE
jgi:hypothetical protein